MLDEFRSTSITWDKATRRIYSPITANESDENGRKLVVQIVNGGQVEDLTGATLHLYWVTIDKVQDGLDVFDAVDLKKGEFELSYTTGMLSNQGVLNANLVLIDAVGRVVSEQFKITVTEGIDDDAIQSENSFSSLTQALIDVSNLEQNYAPRLNELTEQLTHVVKNGVNIEQFGAVANDPHFNNRQAFLDAFNYLRGLGGGVLYVTDLYYTTAHINIPSNTIVDGLNVGEIKIKADTGNYWAVLWVKEVSNVTIRNLRVNQNVSENTSTNISLGALQNPLANIYVNGATNVLIDNCELNICGVWGIIADAHNENIRVTNCNVHFIEGNSNSVANEYMKFDNTAIFLDAKTSIASGNIISTDNYRGETAIEIHRVDGIAEKNTIRGYRTGIILCPALYEYDDNSQLTLQAINNKMYNVVKGVVLWAFDGVDTDNLIVSGNQIELSAIRHNYPRVHGISANLEFGADHTVVYRNININNNIIISDDDLRTYSDPDATFNFTGISLTGWHNIYNFSIANNTIINASGTGIVVGASDTYTVDGGDISNNTIIDAGSNINIGGGYRSAIIALGSHKNISIGKNTIIDRRQSGTFYKQPLIVIKQNANNTITVSPQSIHDGVNLTQAYLYNWMQVAFENGYTLGTNSRPVSYIKDDNGFVHLRGSMVVGTNGEKGFTLPKGYRPDFYNKDALTINSTGGVYSYKGSGNTEYLDGIVFLAEG